MQLVVKKNTQLLRCCFQMQNLYHVTDITLHYVRDVSDITKKDITTVILDVQWIESD